MITKKDFPIFSHKPELVYFDAAATTQKTVAVLSVLKNWYNTKNANVRRGLYDLSYNATQDYETARQIIAELFSVTTDETVFVKNGTEGLNLLANGIRHKLKPGQNIVVSSLEHHSNLLPWMRIAKETGIALRFLSHNNGLTDLASANKLIDKNTAIVSITHASNVLGKIQPIAQISQIAKRHDALVFVDGSQVVAHKDIRPWDLDVDAYVFSGHKAYGINGCGVVFIRKNLQSILEPLLVGGEMVSQVTNNDYTYLPTPHKYEAGTPDAAAVISLQHALTWLTQNRKEISQNEKKLFQMIRKILRQHNFIVHTPENAELPILSFSHRTLHPHDIASLLNEHGIAVRAGYCCAQPLAEQLNPNGVVRISLGAWNDVSDVQVLAKALDALESITK